MVSGKEKQHVTVTESGSLTFDVTSKADEGMYACGGVNGAGAVLAWANLKVLAPEDLPPPIIQVSITKGRQKTEIHLFQPVQTLIIFIILL